MKAEKKSVYMMPDDVERLEAVLGDLKAELPAYRVSISWVFRYALYKLSRARGLESPPVTAFWRGEVDE